MLTECSQPVTIPLSERNSFRNIAPENPVRIGARNFSTMASDRDRYVREKYKPESPANL